MRQALLPLRKRNAQNVFFLDLPHNARQPEAVTGLHLVCNSKRGPSVEEVQMARNDISEKASTTGGTQAAAEVGEKTVTPVPHSTALFTSQDHGLQTDVIVATSRRDYSDRERLQRLYNLGIALVRWAGRLQHRSVAAIAAGCINSISILRLLTYVKEQVNLYAPECVASGPETLIGNPADPVLDAELYVATQLATHIDENFCIRWVPANPTAGDTLEDGLLDWEYVEPETPSPSVVCKSVSYEEKKAVQLFDWHNLPRRVERAARLASAAVKELVDKVQSDGKGGFARSRVEEELKTQPHKSAERQLHDKFMRTIDALADLTSRSDYGQANDWAQGTQLLQTIYGTWIDKCYGPTVTGSNSHSKRSTRKSKKDALRRLIAAVSQYGLLLQGETEMFRTVTAIKLLNTFGYKISDGVRRICPDIQKPDAHAVRELVRALDEKAVTDSDREYWVRCLGPRAEACGRLAEIIGGHASAQSTAWGPKEHAAKLKKAGIFTTKKPDDEFTEIRLRMQEAGIAVQGPWEFIAGRKSEPETKKGVADKWLLSPMAQILAPDSD